MEIMKKALSLTSEMHFNLENEISFSHSQKARDLENLSVEFLLEIQSGCCWNKLLSISFWSQLVIVTEGQQKSFSELSLHCFKALITICTYLSEVFSPNLIELSQFTFLPGITSSSLVLFMYNQPSRVEIAAGPVMALAGSTHEQYLKEAGKEGTGRLFGDLHGGLASVAAG